MSYHAIYRPEEAAESRNSTILNLLHTDEPTDVLLHLQAIPDSIAMELEAQDYEEALQELHDLGFTC